MRLLIVTSQEDLIERERDATYNDWSNTGHYSDDSDVDSRGLGTHSWHAEILQ